jgi:hypothetical protein
MEDNKEVPQPEAEVVKEEVVVENSVEVKSEDVVESEREKNLKAEARRKAEEIQRLRDELQAAKSQQAYNPNDLTTWKDNELKAVMRDPQYAHLHDQAENILDKRKFNRFIKEQTHLSARQQSELERQKNFPETLDPSHPTTLRMQEILNQNPGLDQTPTGLLIAAKIAASESKVKKAEVTGRKKEQDRQADVKASYSGENRPAPVATDKVKDEELYKQASQGDKNSLYALMKKRGLA